MTLSAPERGQTIVAVDIGGTHARFAIATTEPGQRPSLGSAVTFRTQDYASLSTAWEAFAERCESPLPAAAAICVASPVNADTIKLTNSHWVMQQSTLASDLGVDELLLMNDFGAMAWAVAQLQADELEHICGPDNHPSNHGVTTVLGPGTGLGVALLMRREGRVFVVETEGGHLDFAPLDKLETAILDRLRDRFLRVSTERVVAGPGLNNIYEAMAAIEGRAVTQRSDADLWADALAGDDRLAAEALQRFCLCLGAVTGDLALAQGANNVVLTGGLALRLKAQLRKPGFSARFRAKGRFESLMAEIPVRLAVHPQPGLLGAAAAYANRS